MITSAKLAEDAFQGLTNDFRMGNDGQTEGMVNGALLKWDGDLIRLAVHPQD